MAEKEIKHQIKQDLCILADRQAIIVSPLAAVPKGETEVTLIHDVSRPESDTINGLTGHHTERCQTVEEAGWLAKPGYFSAKAGLLSAYHSVPIHPGCCKTTGNLPGTVQRPFSLMHISPLGPNVGQAS